MNANQQTPSPDPLVQFAHLLTNPVLYTWDAIANSPDVDWDWDGYNIFISPVQQQKDC